MSCELCWQQVWTGVESKTETAESFPGRGTYERTNDDDDTWSYMIHDTFPVTAENQPPWYQQFAIIGRWWLATLGSLAINVAPVTFGR